MPPKPKYTSEQIIRAALEIVAQKGANALTAKELAHALNTSTTPIFTVFNSMQEIQQAVKQAAMGCFESYVRRTGKSTPIFKQIGMQMVLFAKEQPHLYQLVFMSANREVQSFDDVYVHLGDVASESLNALQQDYGLAEADAKALFEHTWIHTFGIGALCATGMCNFSEAQISNMLTQDFTAMLQMLHANAQKAENLCK